MAHRNIQLVVLFFTLIVITYSTTARSDVGTEDTQLLIESLTEGLRMDPYLRADPNFTLNFKEYVDRNINNFKNHIEMRKRRYRRKRNAEEDKSDMKNLVELKLIATIPTQNGTDTKLFSQQNEWYAASLEDNGDRLNIWKLQQNLFSLIQNASVQDATRVAAIPLRSSTLIVVAEDKVIYEKTDNLTKIFDLSNDRLNVIQRIKEFGVNDVAMWNTDEDVFISLLRNDDQANVSLYRWTEGYFDSIQSLETFGGSKLSSFSIDHIHFIAVANTKSEGSSRIYSKMYKFDEELRTYQPFQSILTYVCSDMRYFRVRFGKVDNHFLIAVNSYRNNTSGVKEYDTMSVIYKYVDGYFIPFQTLRINGVEAVEPITINDDTILVATTLDGLKAWHYDGWNFVEKKVHFSDVPTEKMPTGIRALHSYHFQNQSILLLVTLNATTMFKVNHFFHNELKVEHDEMLSWCKSTMSRINTMHEDGILGKPTRGDITQEVEGESQEGLSDANSVVAELKSLERKLAEAGRLTPDLLQNIKIHLIDRKIKANEIVLNEGNAVVSPNIEVINGVDAQRLTANAINVNEGFEIDTLSFDNVRVEEPITPKKINNHNGILHVNKGIDLDKLKIDGSAIFKKDFKTLKGSNGTTFTGKDHTHKKEKHANETVTKIGRVRSKSIIVGQFVNDMDVPTLQKYAFKRGTQRITETWYFDNLITDNLNTDELSGKALEEFVRTTRGNYVLLKDVMFHETLNINKLNVLERLNNISVHNRKLDILLRNVTEGQLISGVKSFENLELLNSINLQGKIAGKQFEIINPVVKVDGVVDVEGDVIITGNVTVEDILRSKDIRPVNSTTSFSKLSHFGIPLNSSKIRTHLNLQQHINVKDVTTDFVNGISTRSWVVNGADHSQVIRGKKRFLGDLEITGSTQMDNINGIDIRELQKNVLTKEGDQIILGRHLVEIVSSQKRITVGNITFGEHVWNDVITVKGDQVITAPTVIHGNITSTNVQINNMNVGSLAKNLNLKKIEKDAVLKSNLPLKVMGFKSFSTLQIENLNIASLERHLRALEKDEVHLEETNSLENVSADEVYFKKSFNGVEAHEFKPLAQESTVVIEDLEELGNVTIYGEMHVASNLINGLDLNDLKDNTVKIDEEHSFASASLETAFVNDTVTSNGDIENLDLDNIWQNGIEETQIISDKKVFKGKIVSKSNVLIKGTVNGINLSELCPFTSKEIEKHFVIGGNAYFAKGPNILEINGLELEELSKNIWFVDKPAFFNRTVQLRNAGFEDSVVLKGLINGVDLDELSTTYLSKTKDQNISIPIIFEEDVIFENNITAPELSIEGTVNNLDIKYFVENVLLHRDQLFEEVKYIENVSTEEITGDFNLNDLHPATDILRYDKENKIVGPKRFKNLDVGNLFVRKGVTVQGVDIDHWLKSAILKNGTFRVTAAKKIGNATFLNGLGVQGRLNSRRFNKESVLLSSASQQIRGKKVFHPKDTEGVTFKTLKVKGFVNDVDVLDLVQSQANNNTTANVITNEVSFMKNITAKNVNFKKLYRGVNISELLEDITNIGALSHVEDNYRTLLNSSENISESLKSQAFYLDYYKQVMHHFKPYKIVASTFSDKESIIAFHCENYSNIATIFEWDENSESFVQAEDFTINLGPLPKYIDSVQYFGVDYIYIEVEEQYETGYNRVGRLLHFDNLTQFYMIPFSTRGTQFITSFIMTEFQDNCLLFIDLNLTCSIMCSHYINNFDLLQTIDNENAHMASVLHINGSTYIITIRKDEEDSRITIWRMSESFIFEIYQTIYMGEPVSISSATYHGKHFFAVAYRRFEGTLYFGMVKIFRFDEASQKFVTYQYIHLITPIQVEFSILPSDELVLYVVTESTGGEAFNVYIYEGIFGFNKKVAESIVSPIVGINQFSINDKHFVVANHEETIEILKAVFKGHKIH